MLSVPRLNLSHTHAQVTFHLINFIPSCGEIPHSPIVIEHKMQRGHLRKELSY